MKLVRLSLLSVLFAILSCFQASAQLVGNKYIPGDYATITLAVADVNTLGVGAGGVTFNIAAGYTETISATIALTATGTSANPIVFRKDPGTSGVNPLITAYTGGVGTPATAIQDGIWRMQGSDYVTIDGIDLRDNPSNATNPSTMEYGYALYKASTVNGCQYVTIKNCTISLNSINNATSTAPMVYGSVGIMAMNATATAAVTALTPASAAGTNSYNSFYNNTVQDCNVGISLVGYAAPSPYTLADYGNDIGGNSSATGNTILNFGGAPSAARAAEGVWVSAQYDLNVSNNTINNNDGTHVDHANQLRGVDIRAATRANATINNNIVTIKTTGTTQYSYAIINASGSTSASNTIEISGNTITNCTYNTATTGRLYGIYNTATPTNTIIKHNTINNNTITGSGAGYHYLIYNTGAATNVTIDSNTILNNSADGATMKTFAGIYNSGAAQNLSIKCNTIAGAQSGSTGITYYAIYNSGAVVANQHIDSNKIGTATYDAINFSVANTKSLYLIYIYNSGTASNLTVNGNDFQGITYSAGYSATAILLYNRAIPLNQDINYNTFTNINLNSTYRLTLIQSSIAIPAGGSQNVIGNAIIGSLTKNAGGYIYGFVNTATCVSGSIVNHTNNNFSHINATGATTIIGWNCRDAGASTRTVANNIFDDWSGGTGNITVLSLGINGTDNAVYGNTISNITSSATTICISSPAGNDNIYNNTVHGIVVNGTKNATGINISAATTKNVYGNKIYDMQANASGGSVYGISVTGSTAAAITTNIYNNVIGELKAPSANSTSDLIRGISVTSTRANSVINIYYNTIYLDAVSSGTNFNTTCIYHTAQSTATTATLNLRNNILANISTPNGSGYASVLRRSATTLGNYGALSNNNLLYAGVPSTNNVLFWDGTNADQLLVDFKNRVSTRETQSVTDDINNAFVSTSGVSANYLHINTNIPCRAESGGVNISGYTNDIDNDIRQGNPGYVDTGSAPDIGADEFSGIKALPLSGSYTVGVGGNYTSLTNAGGLFATINNIGLAGDVDAYIISDIAETGAYALNQWTEQGVGNYTLTVQPNAATPYIISGNVNGALIKLDGADKVVFDGSFSGVNNYLTFRNTNASGTIGTAFDFSNGATNNELTNCNIEAYADATHGVVQFNTSTVAGGNSNNQITNCNINGTVGGNSSNVCIYSSGTIGKENINNTISNNNIYDYKDRGIDLPATGSSAWTVSGNSFYNGAVSNIISYAPSSSVQGIRILGGAGYAILNNYIGGSTNSCGGVASTYTSTGKIGFEGISLTTVSNTPVSNIKGNTIANIGVSGVPTTVGDAIFTGIKTSGTGINVGGALATDGNKIGTNNTNGSIAISTSTTSNANITTGYGIIHESNDGQIIGNKIGSIDINNIGSSPAGTDFTGIFVNVATAPTVVNKNVIGSTGAGAATNSIRILSSSTATNSSITGIALSALVNSSVQLNANVIDHLSHLSTANTTGGIVGITSAAIAPSTTTISNDTFRNNYIAEHTVGMFYGFSNTGAASSLSIIGNVFVNNGNGSSTGTPTAIVNSGTVTGTININNNFIGNSSSPAFTFDVANSGLATWINNTGGGVAATLSINNNNLQGVVYSTSSSGDNVLIENTAATLSQSINANTFTNLNINTSGDVSFISNDVSLASGGSKDISNNSIAGTFSKAAGGNVALYNSYATSSSGATIINSNNIFSNITLSGATTMSGWVNNDNGAATKTITNNVFSNWSCGSGDVTGISVVNSNLNGNTVNNITTTSGNITGITTGAGSDNIFQNTVNTLSTSGAATVTGIALTDGTSKNIYKNKIYDLLSNHASGTVNGILITGSTIAAANVYNNIIGDLRTPIANNADAIRGISVNATSTNSTFNIYYNTVFITGTSSASLFGTSGIYHAADATATTATLDFRNNSITNTSTPKGAGIAVAVRRSGTSIANYATTSNNNLLYAGTPSTTHLIYYDGTNSDQLIGDFETRVTPADTASVSEDLTTKFSSTVGSSSVFLHMDAAIPSLIESGGKNVVGYTDDFDGQVRQGNIGYSGTGYAPDIGADEVFGVEVIPPTITYTPLSNTTSTTNLNVTGVTITDGSGVNVSAGTKPRIYYKRIVDANTYIDNTSATNGWKYTEATNASSPFTFTIDYSKMYGGASVTAGTIQYFVIAQDLATTANIAINSGTFNTTPSSVALTSSAFPLTGTINSFNIPFSGNYNIGNGQVYTTLTNNDGLFATINNVGLMGHTTFNITSDINTETGANALNAWTEYLGTNYRLLIQPDASTLRTISGIAVNGLIRLNGASRVKIDGARGGSTAYLSFSNSDTTGTTGTAITFTNGCGNDTLKYCQLKAYANATNGVVLFGTSPTIVAGNSNIRVENCDINGTVNGHTSKVAIYSGGTVGKENKTNIIANNNIFDFSEKGMEIAATGSSQWTISNNSIFNGNVSTPYNYPASSVIYGMNILGGSGYVITNNSIGGTTALTGGSNAVYSSATGDISYNGIALTTSSATPASTLKGNTISKITVKPTTSSIGLLCFSGIKTSGSGITIGTTTLGEGNTIGSNTLNGAITITTTTSDTANNSLISGIECNSIGGTVNGNLIGGFDISNIGTNPASSIFSGINVTNTNAPTQINSNIVGSNGVGALSNSIRVRSTSLSLTPAIYGIVLNNGVTSTLTMNSNYVQNIANNSTVSSGKFIGLYNNSAATITMNSNNIKNVIAVANSSVSSTSFIGIYSSGASTITSNTIDNFSYPATGNAAQIIGVYTTGAFNNTINTNTISNLVTASTKTADVETGPASDFTLLGILNNASGSTQTISANNINNIKSTTTAAVNTVSTGIAITASTAGGNIFNNYFSVINNTATGTTPGICGLYAGGGTFNVYNNVIWLVNGTNNNGVKMYGVNHIGASNWNYFYNTVLIDGNVTGMATRTAAFIRPSSGNLYLRNNNFTNSRTGNGNHYAISNIAATPATNWSNTTADNNNLYSKTTTQMGEWGSGVNQTFTQWKSSSLGDGNSKSNAVNVLPATYDLDPYNIANCNLDNGAIPISTPVNITKDILNRNRNATTPCIGAYEFNFVPFTVSASNNSPVCNGSTVDLAVNPNSAINPTFVWRNPLMVNVSTVQNPTILALAGRYKVTVTDETGCSAVDSTLVSLYARPTASLSGSTTICENASTNITMNVTGSGTISGTFSTGDAFSGTAPTITYNVSPDILTTYIVTDMSDDNCDAIIPTDAPDTVTINVIHGGLWTGLTSINWTQASNWLCSIIPDTSTDVIIPSSAPYFPTISSGIVTINGLTLQNGGTLTVNNATLQIGGDLVTTGGKIDATNGTIEMNGIAAQTIPANVFTFNTVKSLTINDTSDVTLNGTLNLTDVLKVSAGDFYTGGFLNLISTATKTAVIDGTGVGSVLDSVTMQRYLPSGFGYRYISSPFVASKVSHLSAAVDLGATFPQLYKYDEDRVSSGFVAYTNPVNVLNPLEGYVANFGTSSTAKTFTLRGVVNNGTVNAPTLYNHNHTYTQGFNLVGNPYPSPIDWNAASGWTKTNIDNAVYYFNNGVTNQYTGTYSSYINGVSSDGIANNLIPSMQGFFVHVSNGSYPVSGTLGVTNLVRVNNLTPVYHKITQTTYPLIRIALKADADSVSDYAVVYMDDDATNDFDTRKDALKLINTDTDIPNIYAISNDAQRLSISAVANTNGTDRIIPLGVQSFKGGMMQMRATLIENLPLGLHPYLLDANTNTAQDLMQNNSYTTTFSEGNTDDRFFIVFSKKSIPEILTNTGLNVYSSNGVLSVVLDAYTGQGGDLILRNIQGQLVYNSKLNGFGVHQINLSVVPGVYIVSYGGNKKVFNRKVYIGK